MLWFDIAVALIVVWALISGFRRGILMQLCSIAGLLVGIFVAMRFGERVGCMTGAEGGTARAVGFALIFIAALILFALVGRALRGVFRFAGLGLADSIGGVVLSGAKTVLIIGLLLSAFDALNEDYGWADPDRLSGSRLYGPMREVAGYVVPYFDTLKEQF